MGFQKEFQKLILIIFLDKTLLTEIHRWQCLKISIVNTEKRKKNTMSQVQVIYLKIHFNNLLTDIIMSLTFFNSQDEEVFEIVDFTSASEW